MEICSHATVLLFTGFALLLFAASFFIKKLETLIWEAVLGILLITGFAAYTKMMLSQDLQLTCGHLFHSESGASSRLDSLSEEKIAELGKALVFEDPEAMTGAGKGQCPLCHGFKPGDPEEAGPNLYWLPERALKVVNSPLYKSEETSVKEACPGCGRGMTPEEYIAESSVCPSCFVVPGYDIKGKGKLESPMPPSNLPVGDLTIDELAAIDTWLYYQRGLKPPSVPEIRRAYEKFIPKADRDKMGQTKISVGGTPRALDLDSPAEMVVKLGCVACHKIPGTPGRIGTLGPILIEGSTADKTVGSPGYRIRVAQGKAFAKTAKEYVIESITRPDAYVNPDYESPVHPGISPMPKDYGDRISFAALSNLADFLLSIDERKARQDGLIP